MHDAMRPLLGHRVLVVEDDYFQSQEVRSALMEAGAEVEGPYGNLSGALSALRRDGFDLAVLDINLRGEKAYLVARGLQEAGVPFIFASVYSGSSLPEEWRHIPTCQKPYQEKHLIALSASLGHQRQGAISY